MLTSPGADTAVLPTDTTRLGQNPDELTVVVFKDNFAARTFRVPLRWISRLGTLVGILALLAVLSTLLATKYYRLSQHGSPGRVNELEEELNTLRSSYSVLQALQTKTLAQAQEDAKKAAAAKTEAPPPTVAVAIPTPKVEPTIAAPAPPPPVAAARPSGTTALLFQDLPANVVAAPADVAVKLTPPKFSWHDGTLLVQTALDYSLNDGGNQQGRIVILARGPSTILAYPNSVLNPAATPVLIAPDHGESFSVSRYREINANFGPLRTPSAIQEVEILIFGDAENGAADAPRPLLIDSRVPVPAPAAEAAPKRTQHPAKAPAKSSAAPTPSAGTSKSTPPSADSPPAPWPGTPGGTTAAPPATNDGTAPTTTSPPASGEGTKQ